MDPATQKYLIEIEQLSQERGGFINLVGGTVRDYLLERSCMDYDFAAPQAPAIAQAFADKIKRTCVPLDETPGRETCRVAIHKDLYFDFTTLQGNTIEEDLAQRDFTINAMAISLPDFTEGKRNLVDPFNGQSDLRNQIIRVVPGRAFEEDPLRLLRAFRFASTLKFDIEPQTLGQIKTHRTQLNKAAKERVSHELLLLLGTARSNIDQLDQAGLFEVLFPGVSKLKTKPGAQSGTTLWDDTRNAITELERILLQPDCFLENHTQRIKDYIDKNNHYPLLKWSALLRPLTTSPAFEAINYLREYRLSNSDIQFIDRTLKFTEIILSEAHSSAGGFNEDAAVYQFVHRSGNELISSLLLSLAVRLGSQEDIKFFIPLINRIFDFYIKRYIPAQDGTVLIDGDILKKKFQLKPSPRFKFILEKVEEARVLGVIQTSEEAEQLAKELIASQVELTE